VSDGNGDRTSIQVRYVCERGHRPAEHGLLEFEPAEARWQQKHHDNRVQRMAECFLESYMEKRKSQGAPPAAAGQEGMEEIQVSSVEAGTSQRKEESL
jgi:hypothetical protein